MTLTEHRHRDGAGGVMQRLSVEYDDDTGDVLIAECFEVDDRPGVYRVVTVPITALLPLAEGLRAAWRTATISDPRQMELRAA